MTITYRGRLGYERITFDDAVRLREMAELNVEAVPGGGGDFRAEPWAWHPALFCVDRWFFIAGCQWSVVGCILEAQNLFLDTKLWPRFLNCYPYESCHNFH